LWHKHHPSGNPQKSYHIPLLKTVLLCLPTRHPKILIT
jgi:hypothetical protein